MDRGTAKVIGYTRVSTTEQLDGYGLAVQEKAVRAYCKANRLRLVTILSDEGISGSNGLDRRQGLAEALGRIEAGEAIGLVVHAFDRLACDLVLQETIYQRLTDQGAQVLSIREPDHDGDQATRDMVRQMMGVFAQYDRARIRGRLMAGKAQKVSEGGYGGGRPAYGTMASNRQLVANPDEEVIVERVVTMRQQGSSYREIAKSLVDVGLATRSGGAWNPNQVRRIVLRAVVA